MKKGFTLIELLVYMALLGIIVLVAGEAFSNSTKFRVRTQSMLESSENASKLAAIFKEDLSQMGAKSWKTLSAATTAPDLFDVDSKVYIDFNNTDPTKVDKSSYILTSGGDLDSIDFRKMEYTETGVFLAVRNVAWYVKDSTLWRSCQTLSGTENGDCPTSATTVVPVKMADKVAKFNITPATPGISSSASASDVLFPASSASGFRLLPRYGKFDTDSLYRVTVNPDTGEVAVSVSGFFSNFDSESGTYNRSGKRAGQVFVGPAVASGGGSGSWSGDCKEFTFVPLETYVFKFNLAFVKDNNMRMFQVGKDHIAVGLRTKTDGNPISGIEDFMVYPPQNSDAEKLSEYGEFSVQDTVKACLAITFAFYSPLAHSGTLTFKNFTVYRKTDEAYHFVDGYNPTNLKEKALVKAFRLEMDVKRRGEIGRVTMVIPTANNGVVATATATSSSP